MVRTGLRDIAGWLNETAREKLTSKRCESTSLAEPRCPDAYTRSIVSLSIFFSLVLFRRCTPLNDVFHLISKNATGANARWESNIGMHHVSLRSR